MDEEGPLIGCEAVFPGEGDVLSRGGLGERVLVSWGGGMMVVGVYVLALYVISCADS